MVIGLEEDVKVDDFVDLGELLGMILKKQLHENGCTFLGRTRK